MFQVQIISFSVFCFISFFTIGKQFDLQCVVHTDEIQAYFWVVLEQSREQLCLKYKPYMSHLLLLGKFECGGGPIFKVVLEC